MCILEHEAAFEAGGFKGIGFNCASRLAKFGANIFFAALNKMQLKAAERRVISRPNGSCDTSLRENAVNSLPEILVERIAELHERSGFLRVA